TLQLFGKKGATYDNNVKNWDSGTSWVRLDDPNAKSNPDVLKLDRAVDWKPGDRVVVTTTDYLPGHSEEVEIIRDTPPAPNRIRIRRIDPLTNLPPAGCPDQSPFGNPDVCGTRYQHNGDLYNLNKLPKRLNNDIKIRNGGNDNGKAAVETRAAVALLTRDIRI